VAPKAKVEKQGFFTMAAHHMRDTLESSRREARRQKSAEIKLTKKPFPKGAVISALLCTVMLLVVLFSYAQVYEMNRTISDLRSESESLTDEAEKLQVELELKDDIRTIERIATEEIGMVKSDRVDTRYISVSGGERIDVIESPEDQTENVNMFTTLLSAIGENFEKLRDRIE
jgi:cell division protein FtsB